MGDRVLVTGAAGFLGAHVAAECVRSGFEVVGLDDLSGGVEENVPPGVELVQGSTTDDALVDRLFRERRFRFVFHLAAYAAEGLSHFIRRFNYENNLGGSANLINAAVNHDVECLLFTSSIAVYGKSQLPMSESLVPQPEDPYGIGKLAVEMDLRAARRVFGLNHVVFRPHNVYGELQNVSDRYRNVVGIFMSQIRRGLPMTVFGDGTQTRAFSYVGDLTGAMVRSVSMPECHGETFNIGTDDPISVLDLAHEVARAMGAPAAIVHLPARPEVVHAYADHGKLRRVFGELPRTPLRTGLERMAAWVSGFGVREPARFSRIEIARNLPPSWV